MDVADLVPAVMRRSLPGALAAAATAAPLRFLLLGALLFAARALLPEAPAAGSAPIRVTQADVERLRAEWRAETRRPPTADELAASLRLFADEQILLREALRLDLDRTDPVVRSRLVQNLRFARRDTATPDATLFAEALALGMAHRDLVARRRLVQAMEERLARGVAPSVAEVDAYVAAHPARYATPRRVSFHHVFLSADRHRGTLRESMARLRERVATLEPAAAARWGDPFLLGRRFAGQSEADVARGFGAAFARALMDAPRGWSGPLQSPYGLHLVHVDAIAPAQVADPARVRRQAYYALLEQREREAVRAQVATLRERYRIEVEGMVLAMGTGS